MVTVRCPEAPAAAFRVVLPLLLLAIAVQTSPGRAESPGDADPAPVLVELFTSQGCSSCPPADRLLSRLADEGRVIALAFHVDYWNYIGWTDPFSSEAWSDRQRHYARAFGSDRIYTPQLVVNGRWEGVGSDRREVENLLRSAAGSSVREIFLEVDGPNEGRLTARLRVALPSDLHAGELGAWIAVTESGFETPVGRGENAHRTLRNDHVVRTLLPLKLRPTESGAEAEGEIRLEPDWKRESLRLVGVLQAESDREIVAAAQLPLGPAAR